MHLAQAALELQCRSLLWRCCPLWCLTCCQCATPRHPQMGSMSLATAQAAAAAAAAFMQQAAQQPGGTGCTTAGPLGTAGTAGATGTGGPAVTKWWHDPQLTFGPPVDTEMLARRPAGGPAALLASAREGPEVQSAPAGQLKRPADSRRRSSMPYSDGPRMRLKRKATADADEASSGTTGHTHDPDGGAGTTAGGPFKVRRGGTWVCVLH